VVCALGAVLVVHACLVSLWMAPNSPVRDVVGNSFLSSYVDPYFKQGSDTLGIGSNRIDEALQIRAWVKNTVEADAGETEWIDVTAIEAEHLVGDFGAARSHLAARRLAASLNLAMLQFDDDQLAIIAEFDQDVSRADMRRQLLAAGSSPRIVQNFLGADEMARRYASLWLDSVINDGEIVAIAYRVGRRAAPRADEDGAATLQSRAFAWFDMGERTPFRGTPEARSVFKDYVEGRNG